MLGGVLGYAAEHGLGRDGDGGLVVKQLKQLCGFLGAEYLPLADHPRWVIGAIERRASAARHGAVVLREPVKRHVVLSSGPDSICSPCSRRQCTEGQSEPGPRLNLYYLLSMHNMCRTTQDRPPQARSTPAAALDHPSEPPDRRPDGNAI